MFNPITRYPLVLAGGVAVLAIAGGVFAGVQSHARGVELARTQGTLATTRTVLAATQTDLSATTEKLVAADEQVTSLGKAVSSARREVKAAEESAALSLETIENLRACALGLGRSAAALLDEDYLGAQSYLTSVDSACHEGAAGADVASDESLSASF